MEFAEVERARALLRSHIPVSRLVRAETLSRASQANVYLKLENEGPTGTFKPRGALHAVLRRAQQGQLPGVVTSSTGNHGAAVAFAARCVGVPATVFLPQNPNPVKRARIAGLGAHIIEAGRDYDEAREHAAAYARDRGWYFVEDGHDPNLIPGAATVGWEIVEQLPEADTIYVPVGDSTLIQGVVLAAKHLKPSLRIVGVQAERAPAYFLSWKEGRVVPTESCDTLADGLAVRCPSEDNVRALRERVDEMVLVSEDELLRAVYRLLLDEHTLAEPAGAATTAAFLQTGRNHAGRSVVLLVTGSNITREYLQRAMEAGGTAEFKGAGAERKE